MPQGRLEESVTELERALEFDPLSFEVRFWLGIMLGLSGCHERAIDECQKIIDLDPAYLPAYFVLAVGYRYRKMFEEALAAQRRAVELSGGSAMMLGWLGLALAESGDTAQARDVLQRIHGIAAQGYVPPSTFAWIHLGLNEIDTAFEWLNRAVEECDQLMMPIKTYGFFAPIRTDPCYLALLRRMNADGAVPVGVFHSATVRPNAKFAENCGPVCPRSAPYWGSDEHASESIRLSRRLRKQTWSSSILCRALLAPCSGTPNTDGAITGPGGARFRYHRETAPLPSGILPHIRAESAIASAAWSFTN